MRKLLTTAFIIVLMSFCSYAQPCSGLGGSQTGNDIIFCSSSEPLTQSVFDIPAGNYVSVYVCSANTYTFTTCINLYLGNTEISVLDEFGGVITGAATDYINDNTCGLSGNDETLVWTPPAAYASGGFVQVVVTQYDDLLMNPCQNIGQNADLQISASGTCAPPGTCCENPQFASGASYSDTGLSTCGLSNEFDFSSSCGSFYMDGPEYVLEFTPSTTTCYMIDVAATGAVGLFVLDACSSGATCIGSSESDTGNPNISIDLTGGVPYTILVSTDPDVLFGNTPCTAFDIDISSCPTGSVCSVAEIISSPYDSGLTSTCGSGDDYEEIQAAGCGATDFYMDGDDYVYSFTPSSTACYTIDLSNTSNWMGFFVFDDCPDGFPTCVGSSGDGFDPDAINLTLDAGITYYIIVASNPDGVSPLGVQCGNYQLTIDECPIGTNCGNPYVIADGPYPVNIAGETTCGLSDDYSTSNCSDDNYIDGEDMVFTFSPAVTGCYNMALTAEAYSSILVLDDCPTSGGACIGWAGSSAANPELDVTLNAGTTYYIIISSWPLPDCLPTFDLAIDMCPSGSVCADPFVIPSSPYTAIGATTCGFGDDYSSSPCGDNNYIDGEDYVMEFTPSSTGCYTLDFTNTDTYLGVFIWDNCPASNGTECLGFGGSTSNATTIDQYLEAGNTYYFVVSTWPAPDCSDFDFNLSECTDDGEDCSNPVTLVTGVSQNLSTCGMGDNYDDSDACGSSFMNGDDIVFEFTPASDGCFDFVLSGASESAADFGLFILDDCPDNPSANCEAQGTGVASTPTVTANLLGGTTYTIVVASSICSDFTIVANSVTCPPGSDCANPEIVTLGSNGSFDTNGAGDDYESTDACGGAYMGGTDFVMEFTPATDDCYNFTTSAGIGFNPVADVGLFILDGCPDVVGTNCLAFDEVMDGFPMADAYLIGGNTYTIVVAVVEFTGPVLVSPSNTIFDLEITAGGTNCPSGINCGNPINLTAPGLYSDLTNCGYASDYDDTDGCMDVYMFGEETVFTFTPGVTDCYDIITSPTATSDPANDDVGLFVLTDCPDVPSADCILNETMENGFPSGSVQLEAGETYYIIVSAIDLVGATAFVDCADFNLEILAGSMTCPSDCSNADEIFLGMNPGFSSCGAGDDYSEADIEASCGNSLDFYMNSEESVMTFTPGASGCYIFETSNGSNFDADPALFILDACPDQSPSCVAIGVDENDMPAITAELIGGQTYYIVFSAIEITSNSGGVITYTPSCTDFDIEISSCPPQAPVQDCNGAIAVCQSSYSYNDGFLGGGFDPNELPAGTCLLNGELNSVWFTVNVESTGDLSFLIAPNDPSDDYDFAAFDITDNGCEGIPTGASPLLSCNYSISAGVTGTAGPSMPGSPLNNQDAAGTLLNPSIAVTAGQTIVIIVSNFSTSLTGFDIDFSASTANIVDTTPPDFDMITSTLSCDDTSLDITFNEPITCASILECDFTITYPDLTVHGFSNISSAACAGGNFATDFTFDLDDPLDQNGTYTITLGSGCGGVEDNCGNVQDNTTIQFDISDCVTCSIDDIVTVDATCGMDNGEATVTITGTSPFTVVIDGISVTGPSPVTVTGISVGTHTVTITDDSGCMETGSVTINDTPGPTIDMINATEATCGNTDGTAEVTITGNGDFTVTIDGQSATGPSPVTVAGLSPGTHAVDVEDINGCTTSGSVTITEQESPTIDMVTSVNSTCGNADGEATVTISGGAAPYTLVINGMSISGNSPLTITGLPSGSYDVDVTDDNGCTDMSTVSISDDSGPTIDMINATEATCGNTDGTAEVTITGNGDFTVTIDGQSATGPSPVTVAGLSPGTHAVDVEDINGCTTSGSVTITEQESPTIDMVTSVNSTCGNADGEATVTISGGAAPYTLVINGMSISGNSPLTITGLPSGSYDVDVTDDNGCTDMSTVSISDDSGPTIDMINATEATCGNTDGTAEVTITGNGDFTVTIDGQSATGPSPVTVAGLSPGTHAVDVEDINGCTTSGSVTITEQESPTIDMVTSVNSTCGNADGEATVTISGGAAPYTLVINGMSISGNSPLTITGLPSGSYDVDVTDDNGCTDMSTVSISDDSGPTIDMINATEATCGNTDGTAEVTITGNGDFTVTIDGQSATGPSPVTVAGLSPGTHAVDVEDINGCTTSGSVTITEQESPTIDMVTSVNSTCGNADGEATVTISGGAAPYTLVINGMSISGNSPLTITGLPSGSYDVDVTDDNGCTDMSTVSISDDSGPTIDMINATEATCGNTDGTAEVTITGNGDFTVTIDGQSATGPSPVTVAGLSPGTYAVDVEDINGCTTSGSVTITEQESPTIDMVTSVNSTCGNADGEATVTISGGAAPYTLVINGMSISGNSPLTITGLPSGSYDVDVTDDNGCTDMSTVSISDDSGPTIDMINATEATCGNTDGTAEVTITGNGDFTVTIDGQSATGPSPVTVAGLSPGTHAVDVEDINGCTTSGSVTITEQESPTIDMVTSVNSTCGNADGEATVTISGGAAPYTLVINGMSISGNSPLTITGLPSGSYDVDVTDDNGCTDMSTVSISDDSGPTIDMINATEATCGNTDGTAEVTITGNGDFTVTIDGQSATGPSPVTVAGLSPGTHAVDVEDINGCTTSGSVTITEQESPTIDMVTSVNSTCGNADGEATVTISGGAAPYTLVINGMSISGNSPLTITGLPSGSYDVDVTDDNGCTDMSTVSISDDSGPTIDMINATEATCGDADGEAEVVISDGTAPYTVEINGETAMGDSPLTVSNLPAGTFDVNVTDSNGCTALGTVTITDAGSPTIDLISPTDATCGNNDGQVEVSISGGTSPYTVTINLISETGESPITITGLAPGSYNVDVVDANGCTVTGLVTIDEQQSPVIEDIDVTNSTCGNADGEATVTISGGLAPYTVDIDSQSETGANPVTVANLPAGTYDVTVTDDNGCTATSTVTISDDGGPVIEAITPSNEVCGNGAGSAEVVISGGLAPYSVTIGTESASGDSPITINNLPAGTYSVDIVDDNGCMTSGTVTIDETPGPTISSVDITNEICGMTNGALTINLTDGTAPYTYDIGVGTPQVDDNTFTGLAAGTYTILVTDANGCTDEASATINNIPGVMIEDTDITDASCGLDNGQVTITISGGTGPFSYDLSGTIQVNNGTFTDLAEGGYDLIVTDDNGCTAEANITIGGSPGIEISSIDPTDENCGNADGSATINISGGTAPVTYTLDGNIQVDDNIFTGLAAGTYDVNVEDANGCTAMAAITIDEIEGPVIDDIITIDASCGQPDGQATIMVSGGSTPYSYDLDGNIQIDPNNTFTGLASGSYTIIVTDDNGCTVMGTVNINDSDGPSIDNVDITDANCDMATGSVTVTASGGMPPLTISLDGNVNGTNTFNDLLPGNYTVAVEDDNGCITTQTITVGNIPGVQIDDITTIEATCGNSDGSKTVFFSGGSAPYSVTCGVNTQTTSDNSVTFVNLPAGTYSVMVTDVNGCTDQGTATIDEAEAPIINNIVVDDADCGMSTGSLTVNASGGTAPLNYDIGNGAQTSNVFNDLPSGTYTVIVTDANGCTDESTATINDIPGVQIDNIQTTEATCGNADGTKTINVSGGTPPYTYDCNGVIQIGNNVYTDLPAGTYTVIVTDAAGCTDMQTATISDADGPEIINIDIIDASCGLSNAEVTISANGGTAPYTYFINGTPQSGNVFSDLPSGDIVILVEDANGCSVSQNEVIGDTPPVTIDNLIITDANCGQNDGEVIVLLGGGTAPFTYILDGVSQTSNNTFIGLLAGTYPLDIIDAQGCTATGSVTIQDLPGVLINDLTIVESSCGLANGSITVNTSGGTPPYTYQINLGTPQASNLFSNLASGTYEIMVTDDNGCTDTANAVINGTDGPSIDDVSTTPSNCGQADGSVTISASGGTTPYSYNLDGIIQSDPDNTFIDLASGNYPITVTDANGCTATATANVTDDGGASIDDVNIIDANCGMPNGMLTIFASGGTAPLTYLLNGNNSGSNVFDNLIPNTYNIEVIDANGCITTASVIVGNIPGVQIDDILTTPETCNQMDGSKTIIVSGGTEPYTFECNGIIQTSGVFNNLSAGTYTVIVTDADGCVDEGSATIGVLEGPLITNIEPTNASCGLDNGALVVNVVDGTQPYSYDIGNGQQSSNQFINLSAGSYVVTVTDDNGCTDTQQTTINDSPGVMIDNVIITNSTCGQADGAKEVLVSGGTAPFTFDCNGTIQDNGIFTNLPAGIYTVIVTDANGCSDSTTANISDEDGPIIDDLSSTPANCGNADGSITVTISGGIAPYQVSAGGQVVSTSDVATISDLPAGSTSVLIEDANGCSVSGSINIESTPGVVIDDIIITDATCGQADGAKEVIISGGTAPYSYDCNGTVQDNGIFNNLPSGSYTVIVTDANGCTDMATAEIMDEDGPLIDSAVATETSCGQNDGSVTISISQGLSPYEVSLDGTTQTTTGTVSFTDLSSGNYSFDVVDANGCATSGSIVVEGSDNPVIDNIMVQDASCNNSDGSLTVQVSLGTAPYMYDIGNGPQSSNVFENLPSGSYTVIVTDNNGCSAQLDTAINDIGGPTITDITVVDASSAGDDGSITVTASGGTPPYTFNVNNVDLISDSSVTFENLGEGTYLITVTDANGCVTTGMATIVNGDCVTIDAINTSNAICDQNNGAITIFASGGVEPYMYSIDNGPLQSSNLFMGVGQGSYLITVIDDAGCTSTQTVEIVQNGSPSISNVIVVDATCGENNGDISITATDGLPPYSYSVNGITFQDNPNFSNLQANTYDIIVEDDNGCQVTQQVVIENLTMPIVDDLIIVNATCGDMDGSVTFIVSGAIGQVQYAINGGAFQGSNLFENLEAGAYTYQILDDNCLVEGVLAITNEGAPEISDIDITNATCNSADGEVTISIIPGTAPHTYTLGNITQIDNPTFTGLPAGQYTIVVEDANGCIGSEVFEIIEQGELDINIIGNLFVCEDGFTELMAEPLDQGYDFIWSIDGITTTNLLVTADNAGTITLTATKGDCVGTALVDVTLVPLPIAEAGNAQELNCNNPSVTLDASASTGTDITFLWSTMDGNIIGDPDQASIEVNSTGTYQVLITEGINGCSSTDIVVVSQANDVPNAEAGPGGTLDCDNTTYSLNGNGSSQGSNYSYEWTGDNNQTIINPNTLTPTVSQIGLYTLQVTDNTSGCTAIDVVEVTADESLPSGISLDLVNPDCFGDSNGSIAILDVQGGQGPYQYSFGGGAFADRTEFDNLTAGTYNIIVMAANGCQYTETVVVDDGINLTVDLGPDQFIDFGDIANINAVTNEDIANIVDVQWSISPEDEELCATCLDQTLMPPVTTFFILDITNDKGCTAQDNLTVFVHLEQTIHVPNIFSPDGDGINDIFYITTEDNVEAQINYMRVLDRWGNLVFNNENFEPNNPLDGWDGTWDGKRLAPQVFVYVIEVEFTLETEVKTQLFKGDITIKN